MPFRLWVVSHLNSSLSWWSLPDRSLQRLALLLDHLYLDAKDTSPEQENKLLATPKQLQLEGSYGYKQSKGLPASKHQTYGNKAATVEKVKHKSHLLQGQLKLWLINTEQWGKNNRRKIASKDTVKQIIYLKESTFSLINIVLSHWSDLRGVNDTQNGCSCSSTLQQQVPQRDPERLKPGRCEKERTRGQGGRVWLRGHKPEVKLLLVQTGWLDDGWMDGW